MTREEKEAYVSRLVAELQETKAAIFTQYRGTTVAQMNQLRDQLYDKGITYKVTKNSLVKRALDEAGVTLSDISVLDHPVALATGQDDEVTVSKAIVAAHKEFESIVPVAGIINGEFVPSTVIIALSQLPGREELYGKMVGSLAGLTTRMVRTIANPMQGLVTALAQLQTQKEA
jgi:large subunit ribosomal protein L10